MEKAPGSAYVIEKTSLQSYLSSAAGRNVGMDAPLVNFAFNKDVTIVL